MPQLPTAEQLGVVQPQPGSYVPRVGPEAAAPGEALTRVGTAVGNLGQTVLNVQDDMAYSQANSALWQGKVALDAKYKNDPDPATAPQRYQAELQGLADQAGSGIVQPRYRQQFNDMAQRFVIARGVESVQNASDAALTNQAVAKLGNSADAGVTAFANTDDAATHAGIAQAYNSQVDAMVKGRIIDATNGEKLKKEFVHRAAYAYIAAGKTPDEMLRRWNAFNGEEGGQTVATAAQPPAPGASDAYRQAIIQGESGGDVTRVNPKSGAAGRYQMLPSTAAQYGLTPADLTNPDPKVQAKVDAAWQKFTADNRAALTTSLGRIPTDAELSLAQQQGAAGAAALLNNPNSKAADLVGQKAVIDNGGSAGMTAASFAQHVMGYYGASNEGSTGGQTAPSDTMVTTPRPGSLAANLPADTYALMATGIQREINGQQAALDHQQVEAAKIQKQQADDAIVSYQHIMDMNSADSSQPPIDWSAVINDPRLAHDPTALPALHAYQKSLDHPTQNDTLDKQVTAQLYRGYLNGTATTKDFQEAFAPSDGSAPKISRPNLEFLMNLAKSGGDSVDAKNTNALKDAFIKNNDYRITHDPSGMAIDLPAAHDADYRFLTDFDAAWQAKVKAGENPRSLIDPKSPDYFGSPANMKNYVKTAEEWLAEEQKAQEAANPSGPGFFGKIANALSAIGGGGSAKSTAPQIPSDLPQGTIYAGKTKDGRDAYRLPDGSLKAVGATPAPVQPAQADAAPVVPSGE